MICASAHFFTKAYSSLRIVSFICNLINSFGFFENLSLITLWIVCGKKCVLYTLKIKHFQFLPLYHFSLLMFAWALMWLRQLLTMLSLHCFNPSAVQCGFVTSTLALTQAFVHIFPYQYISTSAPHSSYVIFTILSMLCNFTNWQFHEIIYFKRHFAFTAKNHWQYCDFCGQLIVPEQNTELYFGLFTFCKCCVKFCIRHWSSSSFIAGSSETVTFRISTFGESAL